MAQTNSVNYKTTQYNVIVGAASNNISNIAPASTSGTPFCSAGAASNPAFNATPTVTQMTVSNTPVNPTDTANKLYVDTAIASVNPGTSVYAATTVNIPGTYTSVAAGIGDTFLTTATGAFTLDGTTPAVASRILFKNQGTTLQNGVYTLTTNGTGITGTLFTRALDYDQPSNINSTGVIAVVNGTVNQLTGWLLNVTVTAVGVDPITYVQFSEAPITVTQYNSLVGGPSNTIVSIAPSATSGMALTSTGSSSNPTFANQVVVAGGGTGNTSATAYAVQCGGTTSTAAFQSIASVGTAGQILTSNGASALPTFQDSAVNPASTIYLWDDFINCGSQYTSNSGVLASQLGWIIGSTNTAGWGAGANAFDDINHPGILGNTAITSSENCLWGGCNNGSASGAQYGGIMLGGGAITMWFYFKIATLSAAGNRYVLRMGLSDAPESSNASRVVMMTYTDNSNSGNWRFATGDGSTTTTNNSSTAATTGWHKGQIVINAGGTTADFYMDGTHLGQNTTNLPTVNPIGLWFDLTGTATSSEIGLDLITCQIVLTTPR